jgi:DNA-binding transcriptional LysR family regulator
MQPACLKKCITKTDSLCWFRSLELMLGPMSATSLPPVAEPLGGPWSALELRHLQALLGVADEGTFSRAATRLGYTQSAVSQQIAALERMVGTPLFDRPGGPRPVELTEAGRSMVEHARGVLRRLGAAQAEVAAIAAGDRGTIRVGTVQSVGTRVLPRVLATFHERRPGVDIVLRESYDVYELLDAVADGELDITFTEVPPESRFEYRRMLDDPFVLVAPAGSEIAERGSIPVGEIAALPLIGYRNGACSTVVERIFRPSDEPTYVFRSDDNPTIQGCVASGIGCWATPLLTVDTDDPAVAIVPIEPAPEPRHIALAWPATRRSSPAVAEFVDVAAEVGRDVEQRLTDVMAASTAAPRVPAASPGA